MNQSLATFYDFLEHSRNQRSLVRNFADIDNLITSEDATMLDENERTIFFIVYLVIFSLSMIGNIATLCTTYERKIRLIQKMLIISLALSDIIVCFFIGVNNMINFSHPYFNWILGDFMCSFVPYMQTTGAVANSVTMVSIACDRYVNILRPTSKQWNPNIWWCLVLLITIWGIAAGSSYPMFYFHLIIQFTVILTDKDKNVISENLLYLDLCVTSNKRWHAYYYTIIFSIIFVPLMLLFLWFYYKIAKLIWQQRNSSIYKTATNNPSVTMETSTDTKFNTNISPDPIKKKKIKSSLHMEKKIRTFKIILIIMFVFFVCRMPHWIFNMLKYYKELEISIGWVSAYSLSLLVIFNTTLNPFLYSFLNQTIMYFDMFFISIGDFISNICCCCCSNTEFDQFEKEEHYYEKFEQRQSQTSSIIPRGPYADSENKQNKEKKVKIEFLHESSQKTNTY